MDDEEVQDYAGAVKDSLIAEVSSSTQGIALANDTIRWRLEANARELRVVLAEREAMKAALEQGEAELALAEAHEANRATRSAREATKSSKAPAQSASPPPTTTKAKPPRSSNRSVPRNLALLLPFIPQPPLRQAPLVLVLVLVLVLNPSSFLTIRRPRRLRSASLRMRR